MGTMTGVVGMVISRKGSLLRYQDGYHATEFLSLHDSLTSYVAEVETTSKQISTALMRLICYFLSFK